MFFVLDTGAVKRPGRARVPGRISLRLALGLLICSIPSIEAAEPRWSAKFDERVMFYQATELGVLVIGTEKSLYAVTSETGQVLWRRKHARLSETDVAAVPGTDVLLLSLERGDRTRLEAVDLLTGGALWRGDKAHGSVMQMAFDPGAGVVAVVSVRDARGRASGEFKRKAVVQAFDLRRGRELWRRELDSEIEMMPALLGVSEDEDLSYTLDNYRPPAFFDGRLYLFYEGVTSLDARTGEERRREKFRVNEEGLALTEADPVSDERFVYFSGRGRVRAISRADGREVWEAKDLGLTPEIALAGGALYARTGGRFTRLEDGQSVERGPYGVSAIDASTGKTLWRFKGADKGITNMLLPDASTVVVADGDDLIAIDASTGQPRAKIPHGVERAAFALLNERGHAVVGGRNEIAAFDLAANRAVWRARHDPPGRSIFGTVAAVTTRAASLYFRYGAAGTTVFGGIRLLSAAEGLRWSGLAAHATAPNLTSLATDYSRHYLRERFTPFGILSRASGATFSAPERLPTRPSIDVPAPSVDVEERLLDGLDPAARLEALSRFAGRRQRLSALRGHWMYFYTDLKGDGNGLIGININTGVPERAVGLSDPDQRFISDEASALLYSSKDNRLNAYALGSRD
jgi:outer membrane protein assembly factor BamB